MGPPESNQENMQDVTQELHVSLIEHPEELEAILHKYFSSAGEAVEDGTGPREVTYPGWPDKWAIRLHFSKSGGIIKAERGPAASDQVFDSIKNDVESGILTDSGTVVGSGVCFSLYRQEGWYRFRDWFQIRPVPADAPRLNCLLGDFPFLLEFSAARSTEPLVQSRRLARSYREVSLLLCGLSCSPVWGLGDMRFHWVVLPETMESRFCPEGYVLRGSQTPSSGFIDRPTDAPSIPLKAPLEVYSVYTQCAGAPFELPENIPVLLDAFGRLSREQRHRFLRSCYWLQQATRTFVQSFSHSFLAAVSAVETLLDIRDYSLCESCGQKIFKGNSIRQSFADFLAGYVPLQTLTDRGHLHRPAFEERLKVLYDRRIDDRARSGHCCS